MKRSIFSLVCLLLLISILFSPAVLAGVNLEQLWESYIPTCNTSSTIVSNQWSYAIFTSNATMPHTVDKISIMGYRLLAPGTLTVSLRLAPAGVISNTDLAYGSLDTPDVSTTNNTWYDITLNTEYSILPNTTYAILVRCPAGAVGTDAFYWGALAGGDGSAATATYISTDSGQTWGIQTYDSAFKIWGSPSLAVINSDIFTSYMSTGDWIIVNEIQCTEAPYYPSDDPARYLSVQLISDNGTAVTILGENRVVSWERQPLSIYLNATKSASLEWGNVSQYRVRITDGTYYDDYALAVTDWRGSDLYFLDQWVRLTAIDLEDYYNTTFLVNVSGKGLVLNEDAGIMFQAGISALNQVRPDLFQIAINQPTYTPKTWTHAYEDSTTWQAQVGPTIAGQWQYIADFMGTDAKTIGEFLILAVYCLIAFLTTERGFAWAGIIIAFPIVTAGMVLRVLSIQAMLVIVAIVLFLLIKEMWWKGA